MGETEIYQLGDFLILWLVFGLGHSFLPIIEIWSQLGTVDSSFCSGKEESHEEMCHVNVDE